MKYTSAPISTMPPSLEMNCCGGTLKAEAWWWHESFHQKCRLVKMCFCKYNLIGDVMPGGDMRAIIRNAQACGNCVFANKILVGDVMRVIIRNEDLLKCIFAKKINLVMWWEFPSEIRRLVKMFFCKENVVAIQINHPCVKTLNLFLIVWENL